MAYARFIDTDIYMYRHREGWICMACKLEKEKHTETHDAKGRPIMPSFDTPDRARMIAHLREHVAQCHDIGEALERLLEEDQLNA